MRTHGRGGRGTCPDPLRRVRGSITLEAAAGMSMLLLTTLLLALALAVGGAALGLVGRARDAARVAAMAADRTEALQAARRLAGSGTDVSVTSDGRLVTVHLRRSVRAGTLPAITLATSATALEEVPW